VDLSRYSLFELSAMVREGDVSATEVCTFFLERIEAGNPSLNAFVAVDGESALARARELDAIRAKGEPLGQLAGIPVGVKDLEDAAGFRTVRGSFLFADSPPAKEDSHLVARLKAAGAVVVGKTNTPEMGYYADTTNPVFGATRNPLNSDRSAGGSSGGSAAAVAASMVPLTTASDGGGSIRIPASLCGLPGFKPSLGRIPGGPGVPSWFELSSKGVIARTTKDVAFALDAVIGPSQDDISSLPLPEVSWYDSLKDLKLPRSVGYSEDLGYAELDREVRAVVRRAVERIAAQGVEVIEYANLFPSDPVGHWLVMNTSYILRELRPFKGSPSWEKVDPLLRMLLEAAESYGAQDLLQAEAACWELNFRLVVRLAKTRLLLTPTVAGRWPRPGEPGTINGATDLNWIKCTYPFNMTRSPAGCVPVGVTSDGMPVGLQIVGPQHADVAVLRMMAVCEELFSDWRERTAAPDAH
jgi:Asp-tRNA(Asn)/Glu-tRNA(Gln) amidotransferase A subunit family amidase